MAQPSPVSNPAAQVGGTFKPINTSTTTGAAPASASSMSSPAPPPAQVSSPTKELNIAKLCRTGQDMVQDILQKTTDIFKELKVTQLPNGTTITPPMVQDKRAKLEEHIRGVSANFRNLLRVYNKVREYREDKAIEDYLPIEEDGVVKGETPHLSENFMYISEEHKDLIEQIQLKNQQLKDIIDHTRMMIWEINMMMAIKRS